MLSAKCPRPLADGKTPYERRFGEPFEGPISHFGAVVEYYPISARDQSRLHQCGKKVLPGIFLGYALIAGAGIWKGVVLVADIEELEKMDASEIHAWRHSPQTGDTFIFPLAHGTTKSSGRDHEFRESALRQEQLARSEDLSGELQSEREGFQPTESRGDAKTRRDFWSVQGDFIYRHHNEPRVQLHVPKEETFLIPLTYIDGTRSHHTNVDVLQENRMGDYWNVERNGSLSESRIGFTMFTLLKAKHPKKIHVVWEETKNSSNYQT